MKQVFINLAVKDVEKSMNFYTKLGFTLNPQFSDDQAKCMVWSEAIFVMIMSHDKFKTFTKKPLAETKNAIAGLFALSVESTHKVNEVVENGLKAGGSERGLRWTHMGNLLYGCDKSARTRLTFKLRHMANKIDDFISKLKHPLRSEMEEAIKVIRGASKELEEDVKWGGPSFDYKEPMATMNPRIQDYVVFIFHKGELIPDKSGLLESAPKGKAYLKLHSMKEIKDNKVKIQNIVKEWIKLMNA
jgi:predicted lactoylglutathione lyase